MSTITATIVFEDVEVTQDNIDAIYDALMNNTRILHDRTILVKAGE